MPTSKPDTTKSFNPRVPIGQDTIHPSIEAIRLDGRLDRSILSPQLHLILLGMARVRNAVSSFRLEGEVVELNRARDIIESGHAETPAEQGVLKLANAYGALSRGTLPEFTIPGVERLHEQLFEGVLDSDVVGHLKTSRNVITDPSGAIIRFVPTPPERVRAELEALFTWLSTEASALVPPIAAALFFAEFEAIHPFSDGNGRVGRFLNIAVLQKLGLRNAALVPLDTRFFRTSDSYYEALASTNSGRDYFLWTRYYARELRKAYELAARRGDLGRTVSRFSRASTRSVLRWVLAGGGDWFHRRAYPNKRGYSGPAIWGALKELVKAGILEERGEAKGRQYRIRARFLSDVYGRLAGGGPRK